jgi:hypothetical protein
MRSVGVVFIMLLTGSVLGCGDLYRVTAHNTSAPGGIPFFAMKGVCVQETVYGVPYYLITLKISVGSSPVSSDNVNISTNGHKSADFRTLLNELDKPAPDLGTVQDAWSALKQRQSFDPYVENTGEVQLSNKTKVSNVVDYSQGYDINQRKPISGTANAAFKVGENGTLTEVSGQVEDNTLSTVLSALPLSDLIKSAAGIATKVGSAEAQKPEVVKFSLEQEERLRTTTYSRTSDVSAADANCKTGKAIERTAENVSMVVADVGAKDANNKPAATKDENAVGISGTISLPKALFPSPDASNKAAKDSSNGSTTGNDGNSGKASSKNSDKGSGKKKSGSQ